MLNNGHIFFCKIPIIQLSWNTKDGKTLLQYALGNKAENFTIPDGVETVSGFRYNSYLIKLFFHKAYKRYTIWLFLIVRAWKQ